MFGYCRSMRFCCDSYFGNAHESECVFGHGSRWCEESFGELRTDGSLSWSCRLAKGHTGEHSCPSSVDADWGLDEYDKALLRSSLGLSEDVEL